MAHHHQHDKPAEVYVVDIEPFLKDPSSEAAIDACKNVAESLKRFSCLVIKDPRV